MSSVTGAATTAELRLAFACRKLRAFISAIAELRSSEFPHLDSRKALDDLSLYFEARLTQLSRVVPTDDAAVDETLSQINISVSRYTPLLGFILRSTNVRNSFETYFHLKRLVTKILGSSAHLVTSAEWLFIPFTYPMTIDVLPNYVLVGAPAPEAANILIVPLAGHEIGHSAWRQHKIEEHIRAHLVSHINGAQGRHYLSAFECFGRMRTCHQSAVERLPSIVLLSTDIPRA